MFNHVNCNVSKYQTVLLKIEPELCYTMRISVHCIWAHGVFVASASKFHETFTNSALRRVFDCNQEIGKCVRVAFSPDILCSGFMSGRSERTRDILRNDDARALRIIFFPSLSASAFSQRCSENFSVNQQTSKSHALYILYYVLLLLFV